MRRRTTADEPTGSERWRILPVDVVSSACLICGAMVPDGMRELHDEWHEADASRVG